VSKADGLVHWYYLSVIYGAVPCCSPEDAYGKRSNGRAPTLADALTCFRCMEKEKDNMTYYNRFEWFVKGTYS
jgi:hypothetical protein